MKFSKVKPASTRAKGVKASGNRFYLQRGWYPTPDVPREAGVTRGRESIPTIEIIPAVCQLSIVNVGPWRKVSIDLSQGLNIITGGNGTGKSLLLRAIMHAVHPTAVRSLAGGLQPGFLFSGNGRVSVKMTSADIARHVGTVSFGFDDLPATMPASKHNLGRLRLTLEMVKPGDALLVDGVMERLDQQNRKVAIRLLNHATCQVLCIDHKTRLVDYPRARIFECIKVGRDDANIRVIQVGGTGTRHREAKGRSCR